MRWASYWVWNVVDGGTVVFWTSCGDKERLSVAHTASALSPPRVNLAHLTNA
jgi:hypothetical protein